MKKITTLIIAVALCLSVCGCGDGSSFETSASSEFLSSGEKLYHPHLQNFYGRWDYSGEYAGSYPFSTLEVYEDGTCTVDGNSGSWILNEMTTDEHLYVDISVNGENIATILLYLGWNKHFDLGFFSLPVYPGDRWINAQAALALQKEIMDEWGSGLYGQWEVFARECEGLIEPLVFYEDGSVSIGNRLLSWKISDNWSRSDTELDILVCEGEDVLYETKLWREDGDLHGQIYDGSQYIVLYKPSYYEILTITVDNIHDYFEFTTLWNSEYNGFDELESVSTNIEFVLKEPWASRISYLNDDSWDYNTVDNGVIEWSCQLGSFDVILKDDQTFTLENCVSDMTCTDIYNGNGSFRNKTYHFSLPNSYRVYIPGSNLDVERWVAHEGNSFYDYEVIRVKLDLYLIPE